MCVFDSIAGGGDALVLQLLTAAAIAASAGFWLSLYVRGGEGKVLEACAAPLTAWMLFGTLDILVTAKGTFLSPLSEGNPLAAFIFLQSGYLGPVVASVLWIALWAGIVFMINRMRINNAGFFSLAIFWSLAAGHMLGLGSWYMPLCGVSEGIGAFLLGAPLVLKAVIFGAFFATMQHSQKYLTR